MTALFLDLDTAVDVVFAGSKLLLFTESKETAEYLSKRIADELGEPTLCFTGSSKKNLREEVILNFDARVQELRMALGVPRALRRLRPQPQASAARHPVKRQSPRSRVGSA